MSSFPFPTGDSPQAPAPGREKAPGAGPAAVGGLVLSPSGSPVSLLPDLVTECTHPEAHASSLSLRRKWVILSVIFLVQTSMNLNTSLYANGQAGMAEEFGVSHQLTVAGAGVFLVTYAFGCELWAPWSEDIGRKWVLQISLFLVNICCLPVALPPQGMTSIIVARAFGGLFSAGGSVTLGIVADLFGTEAQEHPLAFIVMSSVGGSIIGPIMGGYVETYMTWRWTIWFQFIVGVTVQLLHLLLVPETRSTVLLNKQAKRLRRNGRSPNARGPTEHMTWRQYAMPSEMLAIWFRPFKMFVTEPIVLVLSLLSGVSDAIIFMQIQSFGLVFGKWSFSTIEGGLSFVAIGIGYLLAYLFYIPVISRNRKLRAREPNSEYAQFEARLWWLLYTAPCLPIGLLIFAWGATTAVHWSLCMFGCVLIGIANWTIYMTTIDYMVAAYGPYSASATGGNGFARDFLAGCLTFASKPYYDAFRGDYGVQSANTALAAISLVLVVATYVIFVRGPQLRKRSVFAQSLLTTGVAPLGTAGHAAFAANPAVATNPVVVANVAVVASPAVVADRELMANLAAVAHSTMATSPAA
ncbi:MFS general substrate transporter [Xylariaceae sp. FL0594]|nr:MFS general substrate transporter [Xylariaceae sp. FL0594]